MKAVVIVALLAIVGLAAAQAPTMTKCDTILAVLASAPVEESQRINNATTFLAQVVGTTVGFIAADSPIAGVKTSLFRYFNGSAPYPNILNNGANAVALVTKLINWFGGYLGCSAEAAGLAPTPAAQLGLYESHKHLKISQADARLFNVRVIQAIATVLGTQGIPVEGPVADLAVAIANDLEALVPSYTVNDTVSTFCDKYASKIAYAGVQGNISMLSTYGNINYTAVFGDQAVGDEYAANLAARGPGYAFWFTFVFRRVVLGELVPAQSSGASLARYFNGSINGVANFFASGGANANLPVLVNKLVAWFGAVPAIACSDAEFNAWARTTGAVDANGPINLGPSHYPLGITVADNNAFNAAIVRQAGEVLNPLGLTPAEGTAVANLLASVSSQIIPPAPTNAPVAAPVANAPVAATAPTAPKAPAAAATPKAAGSAVVASFGLVAFALSALLL